MCEAVVDEVDARGEVVTEVVTGLEVVVVGRRLVVTEVVTGFDVSAYGIQTEFPAIEVYPLLHDVHVLH